MNRTHGWAGAIVGLVSRGALTGSCGRFVITATCIANYPSRARRKDAGQGNITWLSNFDYGLVLLPGQSVSTVVGPGCTMLLDELIEFPAEPRLVRAPSLSLPSEPLAFRVINRIWDALFPVARAQSQWRPYTRGVYGHIYSYAQGGPDLDGVTAQQGWTEWEHDRWNSAYMLHSGGWYCTSGLTYPPQGCLYPLQIGNPMASENIGWQPLQAGWRDKNIGPGWVVGRLDWAQFRFNPNTWNHVLYVRRDAYGNGTAQCPMWVDGAVQAGTRQICFYYNLPWPYGGGYRP